MLHFKKMFKRFHSQCKLHVHMRKYVAYIWCEILMIGLKSSNLDLFQAIFFCHWQESPSTIRVKHLGIGAIERTMAYISFFFFLPFGVLKFGMIHVVVKTFCLLRDMARDFTYHTYCFFYIFLRCFKRVGSVFI